MTDYIKFINIFQPHNDSLYKNLYIHRPAYPDEPPPMHFSLHTFRDPQLPE